MSFNPRPRVGGTIYWGTEVAVCAQDAVKPRFTYIVHQPYFLPESSPVS
jgi:hypothetical protein